MPNTVYKYQIPSSANFSLELPRGAEILHVAMQHDSPCFWARVDPARPTELRTFMLVGTGHPINPVAGFKAVHHGSFFMQGGVFVFHLFEHVLRVEHVPL